MPESDRFNISNDEAIRRLRSKGQPIRLFGENDRERRLRLRALELIEERGHDKHGGQNDFKKALEDVENNEREMKAKGKGKKKDENAESQSDGMTMVDLDLVKTNPEKLYPVIYYALKRTLREWGESMEERPGEFFDEAMHWVSSKCACRICEAFNPGQACSSNASPVCSVLETPLQEPSITSEAMKLGPIRHHSNIYS